MKKFKTKIVSALLVVMFVLAGCSANEPKLIDALLSTETVMASTKAKTTKGFDINKVPAYSGKPYVEVNNNKPYFSKKDKKRTTYFERYTLLDKLGRCGVAYVNVTKEFMPKTERGSIGSVKPSGWHTVKYNGYVEGNYLYNRCHLVGYQLTGQNANIYNLITGTRYMNCDGQLPFENKVAEYVKETGNHVLYRVTPIFIGKNLVASGVLTEAYSVEDKGKGISLCVYCYNVQPGITINYKNGKSHLTKNYKGEYATSSYYTTGQTKDYKTDKTDIYTDSTNSDNRVQLKYVLNMSTKKFHKPDCYTIERMNDSNKKTVKTTRNALIKDGYEPCKKCHP